MASDVPSSEVLKTSFDELRKAAGVLNTASDEFGKPIAQLDKALKRLNLGVPAWVTIERQDNGDVGYFWMRQLGYGKIGPRWGIAIREMSGFVDDPERESCEEWLFSDAPRALRIQAIDKLPDLITKLAKEATSMAHELQEKVSRAEAVVEGFLAARSRSSR